MAGLINQRMYDGHFLCRRLEVQGFTSPGVLKAGKTGISKPGNLNLLERADESVTAEGLNP